VIVHGGETVKGRAVPLFEYMLHPERFKLDLKYYYEKQFLPPLRRVLISLANID
jgi:DNA polymerase elongation subunit (family B)